MVDHANGVIHVNDGADGQVMDVSPDDMDIIEMGDISLSGVGHRAVIETNENFGAVLGGKTQPSPHTTARLDDHFVFEVGWRHRPNPIREQVPIQQFVLQNDAVVMLPIARESLSGLANIAGRADADKVRDSLDDRIARVAIVAGQVTGDDGAT